MKVLLTVVISLLSGLAFGQSNAELDTLFTHRKFAQAQKMATDLIKADSNNALPYGITGAVYYEEGKGKDAILYLEKAIVLDKDQTEISAWAHARLGAVYCRSKLQARGVSELRRSIALNKTPEQLKFARYMLTDVLAADKQYGEAAALSKALIADDSTFAAAYLSLGSVYQFTSVYDSAAYNFRRAILFNKNRNWVSSWAHAHLGEIYLQQKQKDSAIAEFTKTIDLGHTKNSVKFAEHILDSLGEELSKDEPKWIVIESANIIFNFQDTAGWGEHTANYIKRHDSAYAVINNTFHAVLPQKLTYKVWNDKGMAKRITGRELGFTKPYRCLSHVHRNQTIGHEITHTLSYWGWGQKAVGDAKLISEGTAVAFNLASTEEEKYAEARAVLAGSGIHSVVDIWDYNSTDDKILYPVGGALMTFLMKECTQNEFKIIVQYQTSSSARNMLGEARFDKLVKEFNKLMGM